MTLVSKNSLKETITALNCPTKESVNHFTAKGTKIVFPEMSRINQALKIEIALDKCLKIAKKNIRHHNKLEVVKEQKELGSSVKLKNLPSLRGPGVFNPQLEISNQKRPKKVTS